ncbi:hypothetical protein [Auraticoccus monumenti]|uniref:Uncharacterized protein n=1 Tax=Auraticoccus monumenti TaxID=675864 RepID=A0A1G6SDV6_9ACTN|nr:hypothetical protein [Auraticoccus monumenti]SDD15049.1 hypothetical protein SAMN04489747_0299 [Auraticoccus monumenti]
MSLPIHPHLLVLRTAATLVLSVLIGQVGWAAAAIGGDPSYFGTHRWWAWLTVAVCLLSLVAYVVLRRSAGTVLLVLAAVVAVLPLVQIALAESDLVALHIFLGVLTVMVGTALTSWTYRHTLPEHATAA